MLDTTVLVDADRKGAALGALAATWVATGEELVVPVQVAIEYCAGRRDPAAGMRALHRSFHVVACDDAIALEAARLAKDAIAEGRFPGWADIQIAATARLLGMAVVTRNARHFAGLGVAVEDHRSALRGGRGRTEAQDPRP